MQHNTRDPHTDAEHEVAPGAVPEPSNPGGTIDADRIVISSGEAPTGGTPVGGHADRKVPDRWVRAHSSATGSGVGPEDNLGGRTVSTGSVTTDEPTDTDAP